MIYQGKTLNKRRNLKAITQLIKVIIICVSVSIISPGFAKNNGKEQLMDNDPIVSSVARALTMANAKARELGFELENFYISVSERLNKTDRRILSITREEYYLWKIYYEPKKIVLGGDLTIYIDRKSWEIIKVWEGE